MSPDPRATKKDKVQEQEKPTTSSQNVDEKIKQLEEEIKQLALTIDSVEDEKLNLENQLKRALADLQNLERALNERVEMRLLQLKKQVAARLIEIIDDIKFGKEASSQLSMMADDVKAWFEGVTGSLNKMEKAIGELGITIMEVIPGDQFDSSKHEAISVAPGDEDNKVVYVAQPGYLMGEYVIRAARVVVSKSGPKPDAK